MVIVDWPSRHSRPRSREEICSAGVVEVGFRKVLVGLRSRVVRIGRYWRHCVMGGPETELVEVIAGNLSFSS
jgi:hypothetical protein